MVEPAEKRDGVGVRPLVSAIITTYTHADSLGEALDSVYAQEGQGSLFDLEVIVVDDASTHDTPGIVARFPATYIRHRVNRGVAAARNTGIGASRGQYLAFLDDDDLWLPWRLRIQVPVMESDPDVGLVYGSRRSAGPSWIGPSGRVFEALLTGNFVPGTTVLVRRAALAKAGYFDEDLRAAEDYDMWLRVAYYFPFKFVPGRFGIYRKSLRGNFMTHIASGLSRELHRRVIGKALAPHLPGEEAQRIREQVELTNFSHLTLLPHHLAVPQMLDHLRECSRLAQYGHVRCELARRVRLEALASSSPLERARALCETLRLAAGNDPQARYLVATVWTEMALGLLFNGRGSEALSAAREAFRRDPTVVVRHSLRRLGDAAKRLAALTPRFRRASS